jgi:hypothetical protein
VIDECAALVIRAALLRVGHMTKSRSAGRPYDEEINMKPAKAKIKTAEIISAVVLAKPDLKLISEVIAGGQEFQVYHTKLVKLFSIDFTAKVKKLKDEIFAVRERSAGKQIPIMNGDGEKMMFWSGFVGFAFGVSPRRIQQLFPVAFDDLPAKHIHNHKHEDRDAAVDLNNDHSFKHKGIIIKPGPTAGKVDLIYRGVTPDEAKEIVQVHPAKPAGVKDLFTNHRAQFDSVFTGLEEEALKTRIAALLKILMDTYGATSDEEMM